MKPLQVLGICGSPRKGNSLFLLERALQAARKGATGVEVDSVSLGGRKLAACNSCFWCVTHKGECKVQDDFQELRAKWLQSQVILYSFPVYHMGIPGQLKCFIDRLGQSGGYIYETRVRRLKVIGAITQGKHLYGGQDVALSFIVQHAVLMRCLPVSGEGGISYIGAGGWAFDLREIHAMRDHYEGGDPYAKITVEAAESIGRRAVELAEIIRSGGIAQKEKLAKDPTYLPFLKELE